MSSAAFFFNTLQQSWKMFMNSNCLSVYPIRDIFLVNIFRKTWNWCKLLKSTTAYFVFKIVYVELMVRVQRHMKIVRYITVYEQKLFKV